MSDAARVMILASGKSCVLVKSDGKFATIESPEPAPPGSLVRARISGVSGPFELKVRGCRKQGAAFLVEGRTQNATREVLAWLTGTSPTVPGTSDEERAAEPREE